MTRAEDDIASLLAAASAAGAARATLRQRSWALRQALLLAAAERAGGRRVQPGQLLDVTDDALARAQRHVRTGALLDPAFVARFLEVAASGTLSPAGAAARTDDTVASRRARLASLRALAAHVGAPLPDQDAATVAGRHPLTGLQRAAVLDLLAVPSPGRGPHRDPFAVRLAAVLHCLLLAPRRPSDLAAMRVDDVTTNRRGVPVAVRDTAGSWQPLPDVGRSAVSRYLQLRAETVAALTGGRHLYLWVSLSPVPRRRADLTSSAWVAGLPLRARGLERSYLRAVARVNAAHADQPGFPLPGSLDLLRRSLTAHRPSGPASTATRART